MIYLFAATDIIRTTVNSAALIDVQLNYTEAVTATGAIAGFGRVFKAFSAAGSDDTLVGPGGSSFRSLKQGTWRNRDTTLNGDVTVAYRATGPVDYEMHKVTLAPGDSLIYIEGVGFFTNKPAAVVDKVLIVASDVVNSTVTFADITGLTYPLISGKKYSILADIIHISAISGTGANFGYNIGAAPTTVQIGNISTITNSVTAAAFSSGVTPTRDTAITAQTTGSAANALTLIAGMIQPSADGTFALRMSSEAAASAVTARAGSWLQIRQER